MKKDRNCGAGVPTPYPMPAQMGMPMQQGMYPMGGMPMNGPMPMQGMPMGGPMPMQGMPMGGPMPMNNMGMPMGQGPMMAGPMMSSNITNTNTATASDGISTNQAVTAVEQLQAQINNLDRRVSRIESMMQDTKANSFSSNKYTDSNYHMM